MPKKAKVTKLADWKKKAGNPTCSLEDLMGVMKPLNPLGVTSEKDLLDKMKASGDPMLARFVDALERQQRGEKVDLRKFSDL